MDLDSLADMMAGDLSVAGTASIGDQHPRFANYKNEGKIKESQSRRRREALERQKDSRFNYVNKLRQIAVGEEVSDDEDNDKPEDSNREDRQSGRAPKPYANRLMLSEWLVDIPEEDRLSGDWLVVPSPKGRRCLLVASGGVTSAYSKSGYRIAQFSSYLPGGSRQDTGSCTLLDGIFDQKMKTVYALDLLMWKDNPMDSADYACRHFCLESRIADNPLLAEKSAHYPYRIVALPAHSCTREALEELLEQKTKYYIDGLMFYHSKVLYSPGQNPLVGWLKPWMLEELFNVNLPAKYKRQEDDQKVGTHAFIQKFNAENNHKSLIRSSAEMEGVCE